jgi:6-phosphogluconolactonase
MSSQAPFRSLLSILLFLVCCLGAMAQNATNQEAASKEGFVYVMTNRADGNTVRVYQRSANGSLSFSQEIATQGLGTGFSLDPFMSQRSLSLSNDGKLLLAVNAASGDITAFTVTSTGLKFGSKASSHGSFPVSVSAYGGLVYVLNQLGTANIAGYTVDGSGNLQYISGSTHNLAGGALALPAEVSFTLDGKQLLVTEKGTDLIDIFEVKGNGSTSGPQTKTSSGNTPFGFTFGPSDSVIVTEVERRLPKEATVSSYQLESDSLASVSPKVANQQTAACWVVVTGDTAWVVNTGTATISSYSVDSGGNLTVLNKVAASTGTDTAPIDLAASNDGKYIYVIKSAVGSVAAYQVDGSKLDFLFEKTGLPLSLQGIVAR